MNSDDLPAEAPEHRSQALSPVSPKPLHFPSPQSIPVLENQMDPIFNDTSNHPSTPPQLEPIPASALNAQPSLAENQHTSVEPEAKGADGSESEYSPDLEPSSSAGIALDASAQNATAVSAVDNPDPSDTLKNDNATPLNTARPLEPDGASQTQTHTGPVQANDVEPVDIQAILDNLLASATPAPSNPTPSGIPAANGDRPAGDVTFDASAKSSLVAGLPNRPDPQVGDNNHSLSTLIQGSTDLHFNNATAPSNSSALNAASASIATPPNPSAGAPGTASIMSGAHAQSGPETGGKSGGDTDKVQKDEDTPWGPDIQKLYDAFLTDEQDYVADGQWEKFPAGSRLFIGNLSSDRVTKRDLFHVFHKHGKLAQISIKQAYGFVQFLTSEDCNHALHTEEGTSIRGRKIHLEISKPQKNSARGGGGNNRRRSRSPDTGRNGQRIDRYRGEGARNRGRDDYRPGSREAYRARSPDRYTGRHRSRSPHSRSARSSNPDDNLPLPRRAPHEVPDLQIIAKDGPDSAFLRYVQQTFEASGVKVDTLLLSPRFEESAVVRRQIIEGVLAVMILTRVNLASQKFNLSIFDRSHGANNVRFEEYNDLDLHTCVALLVRAQKTQQPTKSSSISYSQYGLPLTNNQQPTGYGSQNQYPPQGQNNYSGQQNFPAPSQQSPPSVVPGIDSNMLSQLLGSLRQPGPQGQNNQAPSAPSYQNSSSYGQQQQQQHQTPGQQQQQQNPQYAMSQWSVTPSQQQMSQQSPPAQMAKGHDVQNIMQQLSRYGR